MKEEKKEYTVYMHVNKKNNKKYIGITKLEPTKRWANGEGYKTQQFYKAIQEYGWDGFEHIIICEHLSKKEACDKEIELIKIYHTTNTKYGYNVSSGGDAGNTFGNPIYQYSTNGDFIKKYNNMNEILDIYPNFNIKNIYKCCNGTRKQSYNYMWFYEYKGIKTEPIPSLAKVRGKKKKPVYQYSLDGRFLNKYDSRLYVRQELGIQIDSCLMGITKTAGGFQWFAEYQGDNVPPILYNVELYMHKKSI